MSTETLVTTNDQLNAALRAPFAPGDVLRIAPGRYPGYHVIQDKYGTEAAPITITAADPKNPPVLCDSKTACLQVLACGYLKLSFVNFENAQVNGLHVAWNVEANPGTYVRSYDNLSPAHHITLEDIQIRDTAKQDPFGNNDGLKTSGIDGLTLRRVVVNGWGSGGGSGWDCLNSQDVLAEDCVWDFSHRPANSTAAGITFKAGTRRVKFRRNMLIEAGKVAFQFGQDSGDKRIRDAFGTVLADGTLLNYEAYDIEAWENTIVGSLLPVQFAKSRKSFFHHNTVLLPHVNTGMGRKFFGIAPSFYPDIPRATGGRIEGNLLIYAYAGLEKAGHPFVSFDADPACQTFSFARNRWLQLDAATQGKHYPDTFGANARLGLPTKETDPVYQ